LLKELFAQIPEMSDRAEADLATLKQIEHDRSEAETREAEWARSITYAAEIGLAFKDTLRISPEGISWQGQQFPLAAVTRIRWGATRHSINGIPTGTTYAIAFGDNRSEAAVNTRREEVFSSFVDKLWRAVGVRLLMELLKNLESGRDVRVGEAVVRDSGIILIRHRLLRANEPVDCSWHQTHVWSAEGAFVIGLKGDNKTYVTLPYIETANAHVLEQAIRSAFKLPALSKLSDLLRER
jgi:hypothetical protein